jgi:hypothetical protein
VSGLVDVTGTAYSQDDFQSYRLFAIGAAGSGPSEALAGPDSGGRPRAWNTIGLPEDAAFTLRLEAEDTSGNVAFHEVAVVIDNLPPAAPTGLTALSRCDLGRPRELERTPSPISSAISSYRDGRLANATGVVIGDLRRYIIKPTQFLDPRRARRASSLRGLRHGRGGKRERPVGSGGSDSRHEAAARVIVLPAEGRPSIRRSTSSPKPRTPTSSK